jgi:hypothetical protein
MASETAARNEAAKQGRIRATLPLNTITTFLIVTATKGEDHAQYPCPLASCDQCCSQISRVCYRLPSFRELYFPLC